MTNNTAHVRVLHQILGELQRHREILEKQTEFIKAWMQQDKRYHDQTLNKM